MLNQGGTIEVSYHISTIWGVPPNVHKPWLEPLILWLSGPDGHMAVTFATDEVGNPVEFGSGWGVQIFNICQYNMCHIVLNHT